MEFINTVRQASRVLSVRDIDYQLNADSAFHPATLEGGRLRLTNLLESVYHNPNDDDNKERILASSILSQALSSKRARSVWAVVLESNNEPMFVVQNLACAHTSPGYRRVLRVDIDAVRDYL